MKPKDPPPLEAKIERSERATKYVRWYDCHGCGWEDWADHARNMCPTIGCKGPLNVISNRDDAAPRNIKVEWQRMIDAAWLPYQDDSERRDTPASDPS